MLKTKKARGRFAFILMIAAILTYLTIGGYFVGLHEYDGDPSQAFQMACVWFFYGCLFVAGMFVFAMGVIGIMKWIERGSTEDEQEIDRETQAARPARDEVHGGQD